MAPIPALIMVRFTSHFSHCLPLGPGFEAPDLCVPFYLLLRHEGWSLDRGVLIRP